MPNFIMDSNAAALTAATMAIQAPANNDGHTSDWVAACAVAALNQGR